MLRMSPSPVRVAFTVGVVVALGCLTGTPGYPLGQVVMHTAGNGFGLVTTTRTIPGGCDGGTGSDPCVLQSGCGGGGDGKYLCGLAYERGFPLTLSAAPSQGSTFEGWTVTVTPPNGAPTALPLDTAATKTLNENTHASVDVVVRFSALDAGTD